MLNKRLQNQSSLKKCCLVQEHKSATDRNKTKLIYLTFVVNLQIFRIIYCQFVQHHESIPNQKRKTYFTKTITILHVVCFLSIKGFRRINVHTRENFKQQRLGG